MSPRPYQLGKRQDQIDESRRRVTDAARSLLAEAGSYRAFTVDAVAKKADVAKATIYYQFESKTGLLEAVCDALAEASGMSRLTAAFTNPDPMTALRLFVETFGGFWDVDRAAMRRLRALAVLDPEVGAVISARDDRRRIGLGVLVGRLFDKGTPTSGIDPEDLVTMLHVLTSFETFDGLAKPDSSLTSVVADVVNLAEDALGRMQVARDSGIGSLKPRSSRSPGTDPAGRERGSKR
jgi:AcrR family transcriptional regulator